MTRTFAYCRVSTPDQQHGSQLQEITTAGYEVFPTRIFCETISGSTAAGERLIFSSMVHKLEQGDILVVTKIDRLGRNAMDVRATVERLAAMGVKVVCLALGGVDLTSSAGKMTMGVIACIAEFERDLIVERTQAGVDRAKAAGKHCGRPPKLTSKQVKEISIQLACGASIASMARHHGVSRQTIMRIKSPGARSESAV